MSISYSPQSSQHCLCLNYLAIFLLFSLWILVEPTSGTVTTNEDISAETDKCTNQTTCGACISADAICTWCKNESFVKIRCDTIVTLVASGCPPADIVNPKTELNTITDQPLSEGLKAVQMKPQKVKLRLRPHVAVEVPFKFYLAQDYAVDMYFLMDLSNTMKVHIGQLAQVSKNLVDDIRNLTKSLQVGIGSFVDKCVRPYSIPGPDDDERYDFKQMIKLTDKFTQFQTTVDKLKKMTKDNLDGPEAGLDAVMQSIVCEKEIGWRKESRRLIIYSSDAPFHFGGDGKLGGIVIPNDGECHLNNNKYSQGKNQDYPSVGQIAHKIKENQILVIFAVSAVRLKTYERFVKNIIGAYVSELNSETSTIAEIVKERYKSISSKVEMFSLDKTMDITFMSKCSGSTWIDTKSCDNLKPKQTVEFKAKIPPQKCPPGEHKVIKTIKIMPIGLKKQFEIELEIICGCDCENRSQIMSSDCGSFGNMTCGKCYCDHPELFEKCRMYNTTTECYDQGSCDCGKCFCNKIPNTQNYYNGEYCQCNDYSCQNFNGTICGGIFHGKCICGKCHCEPEFIGDNCGCPVDTSSCLAKNREICNGYGQCECGVCKCNATSGYKGKNCENCPTCGKCSKFEECVKCVVSDGLRFTRKCAQLCNVGVEIVETLHDGKKSVDGREECMVEINECFVKYRNGIKNLSILKEQDCKKKGNRVALIAGIIGGIFFVGIVLLVLWKVITTLQDRRELAKFNKERDMAKWTPQSNPLYVDASTTFRNPMWNSNQDL